MDGLAAIVTAIFIGVAIGLILQFFTPRARLIYWRSHWFVFEIPNPTPPGPIRLTTEAITVQNVGRRLAQRIEIGHATAPTVFHIYPALIRTVDTSSGAHVIQIANLGPREFFVVEFLTFGTTAPELLYIRSQDGPAQRASIQPQRVFPKWFQYLLGFVLLVGAGFLTYWIARGVQFLWQKIFGG